MTREMHIQLQRIDRQRGDHVERGISRAEVIHFDEEA